MRLTGLVESGELLSVDMRNLTLVFLFSLCLSACDNEEVQVVTEEATLLDVECAMHLYGLDVPQDIEKAMPICEKAAEAGAQGAQYVMGVYFLGGGNEEAAIYWFKQAAKNGRTDAIEQLEKLGIKQDIQ